MVIIRDVAASDEAAWHRLWAGYLAFYRTTFADTVTAHTWHRLLVGTSPLIGRVAEIDGILAGFSVSVIHHGTWVTTPICYLEDLFVDPAGRGRGVGHALVQDLVEMARARGWSRLYWHTQGGNEAARRLYDRFAAADDFVRYRVNFA